MSIRVSALRACLAAIGLMVLLGNGCASYRTEQFTVEVHNATTEPLTLSLAKDGPPYEPAWASPEDLAIESPRLREEWKNTPSGIAFLPPGKTASLPGLVGRFEPGTRGYLRAYAGEMNISQMSARGRRSPDRVDVPLAPGANDITIIREQSQLKARVEQNRGGAQGR